MRLLSLLLLCSLASYGFGWVRWCYTTRSLNRNYKPLYTDGRDCDYNNGNPISVCYKQTGDFGVYYGCDNTKEICSGISNSTCKTIDKVHTCCCSTDGCNSAGSPSLFSVITIISGLYTIFWTCI